MRAFRWGIAAFLGFAALDGLFSGDLGGSAILIVLAAIAMPRVRR